MLVELVTVQLWYNWTGAVWSCYNGTGDCSVMLQLSWWNCSVMLQLNWWLFCRVTFELVTVQSCYIWTGYCYVLLQLNWWLFSFSIELWLFSNVGVDLLCLLPGQGPLTSWRQRASWETCGASAPPPARPGSSLPKNPCEPCIITCFLHCCLALVRLGRCRT